MPGDNARAHEKAAALAADALIFDLEDAVAMADKPAAREQIARSLAAINYGNRALYLRINHPETGLAEEDLALFADLPEGVGLVIPKVESPAVIEWVLGGLERLSYNKPADILCNIETPKGILAAEKIAGCHPSVRGLMAGVNDLAALLHLPADPARTGLLHALSHLVLAARAHGLAVYDGVYNQFKNTEGFTIECEQGRILGFDGKALIHPSQVEIANQIFSPGTDEIERAKATVAAWEKQAKGIAVQDGVMVEELHVKTARRMIKQNSTLNT